MKKIFFVVATLVATCTFIAAQEVKVPTIAQKRAEFERMQVIDPKTGDIPTERLQKAYEMANESSQSAVLAKQSMSITDCSNPNWIEIGPDNGPNNIGWGGRVRSVCVLPSNTANKQAFIGGVTGGLWKTTNINMANPRWEKVNDYFQNLSVSTVAYAPNSLVNGVPNTLYFGTGENWENHAVVPDPFEYSDYNKGSGIWKSTNGGVTWALLASTQNNVNFVYTQKIVVTSTGVVYAGTYTGLYKSIDAGVTWTVDNGQANVPVGVTEVSDIELANNGDIYLSLGIGRHGGIWRKNTGSNVWTKVGGNGVNGLPAIAFRRTELAIAPNNPNVVCALLQKAKSQPEDVADDQVRLYRTENNGALWREIPLHGAPTNHQFNGEITLVETDQGGYSVALAIAPDDDKKLYFGNGSLYSGVVGAVAGNSFNVAWSEITSRSGSVDYHDAAGNVIASFAIGKMHPDVHQILFQPGSNTNVYIANDGGVYRTALIAGADPIAISPINNNLRILQYYTCAMSPAANTFDWLGGTQDNESHQFSNAACLSTALMAAPTGDGAFCFINPNNPNQRMVSSYFNDYYRSIDGGLNYTNDAVFAPVNDTYDETGKFINPTDWAVLPNGNVNMFSATNLGNIYRWGNIFGAVPTKTNIPSNKIIGIPSVIKVSPNNPNTIYIGIPYYKAEAAIPPNIPAKPATNAKIIKVTNANGINGNPIFTDITTVPLPDNAYISCIEIKKKAIIPPTTDDEIVITYSNYGTGSVFYTNTAANALPNWIPLDAIAGTLPDMPVRWAVFAPTDAVANPYLHKILLATEVGVWGTTNINTANGPATVWQSINNGALPNVRTQMLRIRESDNMVLAATHGRGMWRSDMYSPIKVNFSANTPNPNPNNNCPTVNFISCTTGAVSYAWDLQNDGITDSNLPSLATNCYYRQQKLTINGNACVVKENLTSGYFCANACIYVNPVDQRPVSTTNTDLPESVILIYPNPNTGIFTIQSTQKIQNVWVTDIAGRVILDIKNPENTVNLSDYPAGVYICTIMTENGVRSAHKIIKE
jgi:Secretion system C-terminal sorting domain